MGFCDRRAWKYYIGFLKFLGNALDEEIEPEEGLACWGLITNG